MKGKSCKTPWPQRLRGEVLPVAFVVALAAILRFFRLGYQSLWADEVASLTTSSLPLPQLLESVAGDIHPPGYHLTLKAWITAFGTSEVGLRSLSAVLGVALVLLTYALGRRLFGTRVAVLAAFFSAISPFQVYYSQETRMYMLLAVVSALAVYALVRFAAEGRWTWAAVYVLANAGGLYVHYSFPIILLMENLVYGLWLILSRGQGHPVRHGVPDRARSGLGQETSAIMGRSIRRGLRWAAMQVVAVALYLPWLPVAYRQVTGWPSISESHSLGFFIAEAFRLFSLGHSLGGPLATGLTFGFGLICVLGAWPANQTSEVSEDFGSLAFRWPRALAHGLLVLYVLFPILMMYVLSLLRPAYRPKFFLVSSPAFALLLALGVWAGPRLPKSLTTSEVWGRVWMVAGVLFVTAASAWSLRNYYFDPAYARDDYRAIARLVAEQGRPGDAVLLNAPGQRYVFGYYYRGGLPVYPLPRQRPPDEAQTVSELQRIAAAHDRIFAVFWATAESDPARIVETWLDEHTYKATDEWYGDVRLVIYAVPQAGEPAGIQHPLRANLGDRVALLGYTLPVTTLRPGDVLPLTLFWQATAEMDVRYKVFVHVLNAEGRVVAQRDAEPGGGVRLTTIWQVGEVVPDNYGVLIPPDTPPGRYQIEVGMYGLDSGQRLPVIEAGGSTTDRILLGSIEVVD